MARHDQTPKKRDMTCRNCKNGDCHECVDVLRAVYTNIPLCTCTRENHSGEIKAIVDPFSDTIYAGDIEVTIDGEVKGLPSE